MERFSPLKTILNINVVLPLQLHPVEIQVNTKTLWKFVNNRLDVIDLTKICLLFHPLRRQKAI